MDPSKGRQSEEVIKKEALEICIQNFEEHNLEIKEILLASESTTEQIEFVFDVVLAVKLENKELQSEVNNLKQENI
jgi:hypothetical protein